MKERHEGKHKGKHAIPSGHPSLSVYSHLFIFLWRLSHILRQWVTCCNTLERAAKARAHGMLQQPRAPGNHTVCHSLRPVAVLVDDPEIEAAQEENVVAAARAALLLAGAEITEVCLLLMRKGKETEACAEIYNHSFCSSSG